MSKLQDSIRILKHLTPVRVWNLCLLRLSYMFAKLTKNTKHLGLPFSLSIEPTTACNLGCPECPSGLKQFTRPTGKIDLTFHDQILNQVAKHVFYINYYFQGEPFLHPQFLTLIRAAKKRKIYTATSTNAHFISPEKAEEIVLSGLDRLIISIDGLTQETYSNYRIDGNLAKVLSGSKFLVEAKEKHQSKTPYLIFQCLAVKQNEHELPKLANLANEIGINEVRIKTVQLYDYKNGHPLMPQNESYSRYKMLANGTYRLKYKMDNSCWRMWSGSVITWDGLLVPCCFDKDATHQFGDLKKDSFSTIIKSPKATSFRKQVFSSRNDISICTNCSEGTKVWI